MARWADRFSSHRVLVVGDIVADEYVVGRPARISREAPVLVLHFGDRYLRPGGATNAAFNLCTLGANVRLVGVIGDDQIGRELRDMLRGLGLETAGLTVDSSRPTSTKTRIMGKGIQEVQQQIVRIDRVDTSVMEERVRDRMIDDVLHGIPEADAVLISDYENGVISPEILAACLPAARRAERMITVDSHGDLFRFKGVTVATPNQPEAELTLKSPMRSEDELRAGGTKLLEEMEAQAVVITRGSEGMALFERGRAPLFLPVAPGEPSQIVDPTGAGDTVSAVFTLAALSGATMPQAAWLANVAGGVVVRRLGPATLTATELEGAAAAAEELGFAAPSDA